MEKKKTTTEETPAYKIMHQSPSAHNMGATELHNVKTETSNATLVPF